MNNSHKTLWELLWDYDPNGLIVMSSDMKVLIVNPSFCKMFHTTREEVIGKDAESILGSVETFKRVWREGIEIRGLEKEYPEYHLFVKKVVFSIRDENIVACILVDLTHEWEQRNEMMRVKRETLEKVNHVVDKQMNVAQQIAGLLGETTAETKVSLINLRKMLDREIS